MTQRQFLEKLIRFFSLTPDEVSHYKTSSNGGEYEVGTGWKGKGLDAKGTVVIKFEEPDGFDMAVYEIIKQASDKKCVIICPRQ